MRDIPVELQTRLDGGVTTLAWCWRVERSDGHVLGFTDHDQSLTFDGVAYAASSAQLNGAVETEIGFAASSSAFGGILDDATIADGDLEAGLFDEARVDLYRVDWMDVSLRMLMWSGTVGEVRRGEAGFEAEVRGLAAAFERTIGRVYQRRCDAVLGDARCTVDVNQPSLRGSGVVSQLIDGRRFYASGLDGFAAGFFTRGFVTWSGGANVGRSSEIDVHRLAATGAVIELLAPPPAQLAVTDAFIAVVGCDKRWRTCREKFTNLINFRGFPMMPGNDWIQRPVRTGETNDGGSLWTDKDR